MSGSIKFDKNAAPVNRRHPGWYYFVTHLYKIEDGLSLKDISDGIKIPIWNASKRSKARLFDPVSRWVNRKKIGNKYYYFCKYPRKNADKILRRIRLVKGIES